MPRRRRIGVYVVAAVAITAVLFTVFSSLWVDILWYREVDLSRVFWTTIRARGSLTVLFGLLFFGLLYANLLIVRRLKPPFRAITAEQEIFERYRLQVEPSLRWILPTLAGVIALFVGVAASTRWEVFLLWRNAGDASFGVADPLFGRDPAFYIFSLPWWKFVQGWLFSALAGVTVITAVAHYLWGGIRPQAPAFADKATPQVRAHLSTLLGLILVVKAWGYYLGTFDLLVSSRGVVTGASYTDVKAQLPALRLLTFIALACAVLFFANIWRKNWALPVIGVGLLALVSIVAGALIPAAVQRFSVDPQELQRERPYIEDNIEFTQRAFKISPDRDIAVSERPVESEVRPEQIESNATTVSNIRLWRPEPTLQEVYGTLQRIRQYYDFLDVDVDRYEIDGDRRMTMLSVREIDQAGIPEGGRTWQNTHLVYTHGFGAVASLPNSATSEGLPVFTLRDIPPIGDPPLEEQPRIYYGENDDAAPFVVVGTQADELDYQGTTDGADEQVTYRYDGTGGIQMGNLLQRAVFAYHFRDVNLVLSGLIDGDSRLMMYRDIRERASRAAPFLEFDADPYAAVIDGRVQWIWDAYTTSADYPYSQRMDLAGPTKDALRGTANYIRNSVKVVVDAYDGTMTYYVVDPEDPMIQVWGRAFPDLFTPGSEAPAELREHFRYPENLFQVQAEQFADYHVDDPDVFYQKQDFWQIAQDPSGIDAAGTARPPLDPYYVLMTLPDEETEEFALILPFTPEGRQNMVAWMAARSDPDDYGGLISYEFPSTRNVEGPTQIFARINAEPRFSAQRTLLTSAGSDVLFGDFLVIPIEDSILYVQPVYVQARQENSIPELTFVLVGNGTRIGFGDTLEEALTDSFVGQTDGSEGEGEAPEGGGQQRLAELITEALARFAAADAALEAGDLATYESEIDAAQDLVQDADELAQRLRERGVDVGGLGEPAPAPEPSATPTVTASPTETPTP
ncbi:MAG: UPF0182 family protein [Actinomycetota bacterium]